MKINIITTVVLIAIVLGLLSCSQKPKMQVQNDAQEIRIEPGDTINVVFFKTPELNETVQVNADGKVSLQLVGMVELAGKTEHEAAAMLSELYKKDLKNPNITVIIRSQGYRRVYIEGEVGSPGYVDIPVKMTVLQAIAMRGGFNKETAALDRVVVLRMNEGSSQVFKVDLKSSLSGEAYTPFVLRAYDVVYVPRKRIVTINTFVDQYINRFFPQALWAVLPLIVYWEFFEK